MITPFWSSDNGETRLAIYQGDALETLRQMPAESVHCVVTSPPYNTLGSRMPPVATGMHKSNKWVSKVAATGYADDMNEEDYSRWLAEVSGLLYRVVRRGGSFFFNHKVRYRDSTPIHPYDLVRQFSRWYLRQEIVWDRCGAFAFNSRMYAPSDERIYWLTKGTDYTWNQAAASLMTVWRISPLSGIDGHPCPFPEELVRRCLAGVTSPSDTVLDPFLGSGTTLLVAQRLGRSGVGIELSADYCRLAAKRIGVEHSQMRLGGRTMP